MSKYDVLKQNPKKFLRKVGISVELFDSLLEKVQNKIQEKQAENPISKRGIKSSLSLSDQLLLTFFYLKSYPTLFDLGVEFALSESQTYKTIKKYTELLHELIGLKSKQSLKITQVKKIIVDTTSQPIERPQQEQEKYYNGSKKDIF